MKRPAASAASAARMWSWRAHSYGGAGALRLEAARVPALRAPDELLVRVRAASLNPIDAAMLGGYGQTLLGALRGVEAATCGGGGAAGAGGGVELPLVVGRDFVGAVVRAGPAARARPGARVWGVLPPHWPGAHQQLLVARDSWTGSAPAGMADAAAGGALYAALTACAALRGAGLQPGCAAPRPAPRLLLLGLGAVGQAALQLLVHAGVPVVVGCSGEQQERARQLGAELVLDRHAPDYDQRLEECGPYAAIIDSAGLGGDEAGARRWRFARYVTLSSPLLRETDARGAVRGAGAAAAALAAQCAGAARACPAPPPPLSGPAAPAHVRWVFFSPEERDIELLRRLADRDQFRVEVERVYPWRAAPAAFARQREGHARGKLLLDFTDDTADIAAPATPAATPAATAAPAAPVAPLQRHHSLI